MVLSRMKMAQMAVAARISNRLGQSMETRLAATLRAIRPTTTMAITFDVLTEEPLLEDWVFMAPS